VAASKKSRVLVGILLIRLPISLALVWLAGYLANETSLKEVPFIVHILAVPTAVFAVFLCFSPLIRMARERGRGPSL
jgi:hypothetical protein